MLGASHIEVVVAAQLVDVELIEVAAGRASAVVIADDEVAASSVVAAAVHLYTELMVARASCELEEERQHMIAGAVGALQSVHVVAGAAIASAVHASNQTAQRDVRELAGSSTRMAGAGLKVA